MIKKSLLEIAALKIARTINYQPVEAATHNELIAINLIAKFQKMYEESKVLMKLYNSLFLK